MSNAETLQQNNTRLSKNNTDLNTLLDTINSLPVAPTEEITITENGTYDVKNYASANVNVLNLYEYATTLRETFNEAVFPENKLDISIKASNLISKTNNLNSTFMRTNLHSIKLELPTDIDLYVWGTFYESKSLETVEFVNTFKPTNSSNYCFINSSSLKEIIGLIDLSLCTTNSGFIDGCPLLEEIRFVENSIIANLGFPSQASLSDQSIQSIIDGLADLTDSTTQTLTFHREVKAKLTDEQKASITNKNWTLA